MSNFGSPVSPRTSRSPGSPGSPSSPDSPGHPRSRRRSVSPVSRQHCSPLKWRQMNRHLWPEPTKGIKHDILPRFLSNISSFVLYARSKNRLIWCAWKTPAIKAFSIEFFFGWSCLFVLSYLCHYRCDWWGKGFLRLYADRGSKSPPQAKRQKDSPKSPVSPPESLVRLIEEGNINGFEELASRLSASERTLAFISKRRYGSGKNRSLVSVAINRGELPLLQVVLRWIPRGQVHQKRCRGSPLWDGVEEKIYLVFAVVYCIDVTSVAFSYKWCRLSSKLFSLKRSRYGMKSRSRRSSSRPRRKLSGNSDLSSGSRALSGNNVHGREKCSDCIFDGAFPFF